MKPSLLYWVLIGSLVLALGAIQGMIWMYREDVRISLLWHLHPLLLAMAIVLLKRLWKPNSESLWRDVLISFFWLLMIGTPSLIYGAYKLGGEDREIGNAFPMRQSMYGKEYDFHE